MSINTKLFTVDAETATGLLPVAEDPSAGGGVLYFNELSDQVGEAGRLGSGSV
jgi:hypothetical protein